MTNNFFLVLFIFWSAIATAQEIASGTVSVDGTSTVASTDEHFVCATIDWWPKEKCDYGHCSWDSSSLLNLNLSHPLLAKAIQAFGQLRVRIGGSLQDQVTYDVENSGLCEPFKIKKGGLFGFSEGCLSINRWDELNEFFKRTGGIVTFGLNALYQRHKNTRKTWGGSWNSSNAYDFLQYTHSRGYEIDSWELGNELNANIDAEIYANDVIELKKIILEVYKNSGKSPSLAAPGGFFDDDWYANFLKNSGANTVDAITHHIYNLGAGNDRHLVSKILDPIFLSRTESTFKRVLQTITQYGPWASPWVGEAGGAYNSGGFNVSDTFVNSFWYMDQLGMASKFNTKVYCRQTLVGGNYGLLSTSSFVPNPDFYSALLWNRLMGKGVLDVDHDASQDLRCYAHCTRGRAGITLLLINLSRSTNFLLNVCRKQNTTLLRVKTGRDEGRVPARLLRRTVSWVGKRVSADQSRREEYHLTAKDGDLRSRTAVLNGVPLILTEEGDIPAMEPALLRLTSPLYVSASSIAFVVFPSFDSPACS